MPFLLAAAAAATLLLFSKPEDDDDLVEGGVEGYANPNPYSLEGAAAARPGDGPHAWLGTEWTGLRGGAPGLDALTLAAP